MKIYINDEFGTRITAVLTLDGNIAVQGKDYVLFDGEYHKNGKWSYREGGIALKNGAFVVLRRSTHSSANGVVVAFIIVDNEIVVQEIIGKVSTMEQYPTFSGIYSDLQKAAFEAHLQSRNADFVEECRKRWEKMESFL